MPRIMPAGPWFGILLLAGVFASIDVMAQAGCTYRKDALDNIRYECDSGISGRLREDAFGNLRDSRTGDRYRKDALGNIRGDDGSRWRRDAFGHWRSDEGVVCRTNALGTTRCK